MSSTIGNRFLAGLVKNGRHLCPQDQSRDANAQYKNWQLLYRPERVERRISCVSSAERAGSPGAREFGYCRLGRDVASYADVSFTTGDRYVEPRASSTG